MRSATLKSLHAGVVYFAFDEELGLYKVGSSNNLTVNFETYLQTWKFDPLRSFFIYSRFDPEDTEYGIHFLLSRLRVAREDMPRKGPGYTEFFRLNSPIKLALLKSGLTAMGYRVNHMSWFPFFTERVKQPLVESYHGQGSYVGAYGKCIKPILIYGGVYKTLAPDLSVNRKTALAALEDFNKSRLHFKQSFDELDVALKALRTQSLSSDMRCKLDLDIASPPDVADVVETTLERLAPRMPKPVRELAIAMLPKPEDLTEAGLASLFTNEPGFLAKRGGIHAQTA